MWKSCSKVARQTEKVAPKIPNVANFVATLLLIKLNI
jgi:hypothetical protein